MAGILEVCADSMESALAAERGGADRIELCGNLVIGGTTPSQALFEKIRKETSLKIRVLLRPRFGDFCYSQNEYEILKEEVKLFRRLGADGIVIGCLNPDGSLNMEQMQGLIAEAGDMDVALHRAFDVSRDALEALEQAKEPTIPELLSRYLDKRSEERTGWTSKGKLKGTVGDFNKVMEALDFLRKKEISTVESLDAYLDEASAQAVSIREEIRPMEKRVKEIDRLLFHIGNFEANKPVHEKYAAIRWKKTKEKFAADHKEELDAYNAALRYFKVHLDGAKYSTKKLAGEQAQLSENIASKTEALTAVQEDVKILRDVRHWLNQVLPSEQYRQTAEPGKKPSIQQAVKGREQRIREEQAEKRQTPRRQQKQDMEL